MKKDTWQISLEDQDVQDICNRDTHLSKLINFIGPMEIELRTNYFTALVRSIIGQLISEKAAHTIFNRLLDLLEHDIAPERVLHNKENIKTVGLSNRKTEYIIHLAKKFVSNEFNLNHVEEMSNEEIVKTLIQMKGIGKWTSEIFLIFSLGKKDVLPIDDVGLHRAAKWLYTSEGEIDGRSFLMEKSANWGENLTIPCLYLWEIVNRDILLKYENIDELLSKKQQV